ncbi:NIF3-like protein 1 isoform X2 [Nilaparvata lugens]|nr:NIF3-like protein 1 isoform X2 [Nilaparvata lugens]
MSGEKCETQQPTGVPLQQVVDQLTAFAPLSLAEPWDNVGLLLEPYTARPVSAILLTNDLTRPVMQECLYKKIDMIIAYHPPIFSGKKRITNKNWQDQLISCCMENRIALYSPHTTWDSVPDGVTDWLASAFGDKSSFKSVSVLEPHTSFAKPADHKFSVRVSCSGFSCGEESKIDDSLQKIGLKITNFDSDGSMRIFSGTCAKSSLLDLRSYASTLYDGSCEVYNLVPLPEPGTGGGRLVELKQPITIEAAIDMMKAHLEVKHARIAYAVGATKETQISSIAVVPGSGAKPLSGVKADLYVTGEMQHHDVLAATHNHASVLMTTHSDSERGFLTYFQDELTERLQGKVKIHVSQADCDPIQVV